MSPLATNGRREDGRREDGRRGTALLTLGRLPVALDLARMLNAEGWRVLVAEPFRWPLTRLSHAVEKSFTVTAPTENADAYLAELLTLINTHQVTLVVPVSEESLFVAALAEQLPDSVRLLCMAQQSLLSLHDKWLFAERARALGLPVPATALASDTVAVARLTNAPFISKPRLSCAGAGVYRGAAGADLPTVQCNSRYIVQKKLPGPSCCTFTIAAGGRCLLSVCYQSLLDAGSVSVCFEQMLCPEEVNHFIRTIVDDTEYTGMIAFDFMQDEQGVWQAIECNPRATSGLHFIPHSILYNALIDHEAGPLSPEPARLQEFWSCLMQTEGALFRGHWDRQAWARLFSTRDITWSKRDSKPFLLMSVIYLPQLWRAFRNRQPLSELLMQDVGWYDNPEGGHSDCV